MVDRLVALVDRSMARYEAFCFGFPPMGLAANLLMYKCSKRFKLNNWVVKEADYYS